LTSRHRQVKHGHEAFYDGVAPIPSPSRPVDLAVEKTDLARQLAPGLPQLRMFDELAIADASGMRKGRACE